MIEKTLNEIDTMMQNNEEFFVVFSADWCPDCRFMDVVMQNFENEMKEKGKTVPVYKVDADKENLYKTDNGWSVLKIPSFYFIKDNKKEFIGYEFVPIEAFWKYI